MADDPIEEAVAAGRDAIREALGFGKATALLDVDCLRTLLASHASLEQRVKGFERVTEPFVMPDWSVPEGPGWGTYKLKSGDLRALAAFVNEKERT